MPKGWNEVDQRLVFLTVQLSTIESSMDATDKALKTNGYQKIAQESAAEAARRKNQAMDLQGGGPVKWQDFYGKTAESFFYHPTDGNTIHVNPGAVPQRPPQFDYIYRANEENRRKAEDDAAKVGNKIDDLLAYRRELEAEQSALWCKIAFRGESSLSLSEQPLYRLDLTGPAGDAGKQSLDAANAGVAFVRTVDLELAAAQKNMDDQKAAVDHLASSTAAARAEMQSKLLKLPAFTATLGTPNDPLGKFCALSKRLEDSSQNLADAYRLAAECDAKDDLAAKRRYRGQMQDMAIDYAQTVAAAHQALSSAVTAWKVTPQAKAGEPANIKSPDADSVTTKLDAAKAAYAVELTAAKRTLVSAVDNRLNAAADAGDLNGVQVFQSAKVKAATDGTVDESITDEAILSAKKTMEQSNAASKSRLAAAYKEAISNLTKARKFPEALAVQAELKNASLESSGESEQAAAGENERDSGNVPPAVSPDGGPAEPKFSGETLSVRLAAPADDVVAGGGGRYLILHIKKLRQLAVFDVNAAKVIKYIDVPSDDIVYAASRDKLIIGVRETGSLLTWNLKTMSKGSSSQGVGPQIKAMAMGYDSHGPLMIVVPKTTYLLSEDSLVRPENFQWDPPWDGSPGSINMSADGHTAVSYNYPGWAGSRCAVLNGLQPVTRHGGGYIHENDMLLPPDGSRIFNTMEGGSIVSPDYQSSAGYEGLPGYGFPSYDSAYFVSYSGKKDRGSNGKTRLAICGVSDRRAIVTLDDLQELEGSAPVKHFQRVHFIPKANLLITIGDGGDSLVLRKLDIYKILMDKGIDYLVITSVPPYLAAKGRALSYQVVVKSLKGNVKFSLESGPKGMTMNAQGLIHWTVPSRPTEENANVIVHVTDDSRQEVFQTFKLTFADASANGEKGR